MATLKLSIHLHHVPGLVSLSTYVYYVYGLMDARFLSYSRHDVPTLVCYKRPHSGADHGSSTGFDSRVVPVELPSCSPKQLRTFTLRPILNEQFTRCRAIWGTLCALAHHHLSEHTAAHSERLLAPLPGHLHSSHLRGQIP